MRINIVGGSNTVYYMLKDHPSTGSGHRLGSASETPSVLRTSPPNPQDKFGIIISTATCVFGGEPIASPDGESLEGVGMQRYYPYGETRLSTGTIYTDKLFTGQQEITGLGIYNYRARMYSPKLGRFLSADTIVPNAYNPQDLNRFAYVRNNPINFIDPSGHCSLGGHQMPDSDAACKWASNNSGSLSGSGNGGFIYGPPAPPYRTLNTSFQMLPYLPGQPQDLSQSANETYTDHSGGGEPEPSNQTVVNIAANAFGLTNDAGIPILATYYSTTTPYDQFVSVNYTSGNLVGINITNATNDSIVINYDVYITNANDSFPIQLNVSVAPGNTAAIPLPANINDSNYNGGYNLTVLANNMCLSICFQNPNFVNLAGGTTFLFNP